MRTHRLSFVATLLALLTPAVALAQGPLQAEMKKLEAAHFYLAREAEILEVAPLAPSTGVRNAPFSADAVTEFTQILGDGNRIERVFTTSIARDSSGRTRREQEIVMLGPLTALQAQQPRLVIILDPAAGVGYTLDAQTRVATRSRSVVQIRGKVAQAAGDPLELSPGTKAFVVGGTTFGVSERKSDNVLTHLTDGTARGVVLQMPAAESKVTTEQLGTRQIEGVSAEGQRTTMTIPAGAVGNINPIDVVTERWFSRELQMEVLISRRDPRSGDTVYRLTNVVRTEPPADLFVVPPDYTIRNQAAISGKLVEQAKKLNSLSTGKGKFE